MIKALIAVFSLMGLASPTMVESEAEPPRTPMIQDVLRRLRVVSQSSECYRAASKIRIYPPNQDGLPVLVDIREIVDNPHSSPFDVTCIGEICRIPDIELRRRFSNFDLVALGMRSHQWTFLMSLASFCPLSSDNIELDHLLATLSYKRSRYMIRYLELVTRWREYPQHLYPKLVALFLHSLTIRNINANYDQMIRIAINKRMGYVVAFLWYLAPHGLRRQLIDESVLPQLLDPSTPADVLRPSALLLMGLKNQDITMTYIGFGIIEPLMVFLQHVGTDFDRTAVVALDKLRVMLEIYDPTFLDINERLIKISAQLGMPDIAGMLMAKIGHRVPDLGLIQNIFDRFQSFGFGLPGSAFIWMSQNVQWNLISHNPQNLLLEKFVDHTGLVDETSLKILISNLVANPQSDNYFGELIRFMKSLPGDWSTEIIQLILLRSNDDDVMDLPIADLNDGESIDVLELGDIDMRNTNMD